MGLGKRFPAVDVHEITFAMKLLAKNGEVVSISGVLEVLLILNLRNIMSDSWSCGEKMRDPRTGAGI